MSDHKANAEALDIALYGTPDIYTPPEAFMPRRASIAEKLAELYPDRDAVDHKEEAENSLDCAADIPFADGDDERRERYHLAEAQVHATLYLAEQQRTANLIAVANAEANIFSPLPQSSPFAPVFAEIREGLGL